MEAVGRHASGKPSRYRWLAAFLVIMTIIAAFVALQLSAGEAATTVDLGTASPYGVLAGSTVTNTGATVVNGDLGVSPGTAVTGFPPGLVTGTTLVGGAAAGAKSDLTIAYNDAAGQPSTGSVGTIGAGADAHVRRIYRLECTACHRHAHPRRPG